MLSLVVSNNEASTTPCSIQTFLNGVHDRYISVARLKAVICVFVLYGYMKIETTSGINFDFVFTGIFLWIFQSNSFVLTSEISSMIMYKEVAYMPTVSSKTGQILFSIDQTSFHFANEERISNCSYLMINNNIQHNIEQERDF